MRQEDGGRYRDQHTGKQTRAGRRGICITCALRLLRFRGSAGRPTVFLRTLGIYPLHGSSSITNLQAQRRKDRTDAGREGERKQSRQQSNCAGKAPTDAGGASYVGLVAGKTLRRYGLRLGLSHCTAHRNEDLDAGCTSLPV